MSTFTTKFNLGDTFYCIDSVLFTTIPVTVRGIFVKQSLSDGSIIHISYRGTMNNITVEILEDSALSLNEAKEQILSLLADRTSQITSI